MWGIPMENSYPTKAPSVTSILRSISDDRALVLFNSIAISDGDTYIPLKGMNLTTKQYYTRISGLLNAGLIKRQKGEYSLTTLGRIVYDTNMTIGQTLTYYWKLKSIESIQISAADKGLPVAELSKIIDTLIDNYKIKDILVRELHVPEDNLVTHRHYQQKNKEEKLKLQK